MIARLLSFLLLAIAVLALVAGSIAGRVGGVAAALLVALVPIALVGFAFAIEAVMLKASRGADPSPEPSWGLLARALLGEARASIPRFFWHQAWAWRPSSEHLDPDAHRGRAGVVLVHGYFCNHGFWWNWKPRLRRADHPFIAVTLEPAFGDVDHTAPIVERAVQRMHAVTGEPVLLVAHSMGGLVVRRWWGLHPETADRLVRQVITIGSPHGGTALARLAHTFNGRQMKMDGPWLTALSQAEPRGRSQRFICFYGHCDNIVFPPARAQLPGADNRHLEGVAHVAMADHPAVIQAVDASLRQADDARAASNRRPGGPAVTPDPHAGPASAQKSGEPNTRSDANPASGSSSGSVETSR